MDAKVIEFRLVSVTFVMLVLFVLLRGSIFM